MLPIRDFRNRNFGISYLIPIKFKHLINIMQHLCQASLLVPPLFCTPKPEFSTILKTETPLQSFCPPTLLTTPASANSKNGCRKPSLTNQHQHLIKKTSRIEVKILLSLNNS